MSQRIVLGVWLILVCCLGGIIGCGQKQTVDTNKITIWHWMTDRDDAFKAIAKQYKDKTGITVEFLNYAPSDSYKVKVNAAAQTNTLPDIFGVLDTKEVYAKFINSDHILDLTSEMDADDRLWKNRFFRRALASNIFEEGNSYKVKQGIYGVPLDVTNIQMLYNKRLFKQAGLDPEKPPLTWDEFIQAYQKLKGVGVRGMVSGWGEGWMIDCFANNYAFNIMGEQKVLDTYRGLVPYTDPDWLKVFGLFDELRREKMLLSDVVTMVNKNAEQSFALERAAFAFNGSWCVNVYKGMNPNLEYGAMLPPRRSDAFPMKIWGGPGSSFMVNAKSPNKDKAVAFLKWITAKDQQAFLAQSTNNLPSDKESLKSISPILAQFADDMDITTHPSVWPLDEKPKVKEAFNKGVQSIIIGEKTPERVAADVQRIKEREDLK
ncbi:MAG: extracellular solute-binding protein [bacterium]